MIKRGLPFGSAVGPHRRVSSSPWPFQERARGLLAATAYLHVSIIPDRLSEGPTSSHFSPIADTSEQVLAYASAVLYCQGMVQIFTGCIGQ
jgi:hypothetical protein